jgi:hypothetical protein
LLLLLLLLMIHLITFASAQFPNILSFSYGTFGQCTSDADCNVNLSLNGTLANLNLHCDPGSSRCEILQNTPVPPPFAANCNNLTMTTLTYPSLFTAGSLFADGIIVVTLNFPSGTTTYEGLLRIYVTTSSFTSSSPPITSTNYFEQQYVNYPTSSFIFRRLAPLAGGSYYGIKYFDIGGCTQPSLILSTPLAVSGVDYPGTISLNSATGYITLPASISKFSSQGGRAISYAITTGGWSGYTSTNMDTYNTGLRRLFCHVLDMGGNVLSTVTCASFPCIAQFPTGNTTVLASIPVGQRGLFSGMITFECGMGYSVRRLVMGQDVRYMIKDSKGIVEGPTEAPVSYYFNAQAMGSTNNISGYGAAPQYYTLSGINMNVRLLNQSDTGVNFNYVDYTKTPGISITAAGTAQRTSFPNIFCNNGTVTGATVVVDYSGFNFLTPFNPANAELMYLNSSSSPGAAPTSFPLQSTNPQQLFKNIGRKVVFNVNATGFYCSVLSVNLLDGLLFRPYLYSCFQVSSPTGAMTQVLAKYSTAAGPQDDYDADYPYLLLAGYGSLIQTIMYIDLPPVLFLPNINNGTTPLGAVYQVQLALNRMSSDPVVLAQLQTYGGLQVNVFNDPISKLSVGAFYNIDNLLPNITRYTIKYSIYNVPPTVGMYSIFYNGATEVLNEVATVALEYINATQQSLHAYTLAPAAPFIEYSCATPMTLNFLAQPNLLVLAEIDDGICTSDFSLITVYNEAGIPFEFNQPLVTAMPGFSAPFNNPATYYEMYTNNATGDVLQSSLNGNRFAAPAVPIRITSYSINGQIGTTVAVPNTVVAAGTTYVTFLPQVPICINGGTTQATKLEFVNGGVTAGAISYWQPAAVLAVELYTPNIVENDIPEDCPLLSADTFPLNMTEFEVFELCYHTNESDVDNSTGCVPLCNNLPPVYEGAYTIGTGGGILITSIQTSNVVNWEAITWVPSPIFDPDVGRYHYCRVANATKALAPQPPFARFTNLRRVTQSNGLPCHGSNCYAVTVTIFVDPNFASLYTAAMVAMVVQPPFEQLSGMAPIPDTDHFVSVDTTYLVTLTLDDVYCPATTTFTPLARGPLIQVVDTTRTSCGDSDSQVLFYVRYDDPDAAETVTSRQTCLFWQYRDVEPPQQSLLQMYFLFELPVNSPTSSTIPDGTLQFNDERMFTDVRAGMHTVIIYDATSDGSCTCVVGTSNPCQPLLDTTTLLLAQNQDGDPDNDLAFQVFDFNVSNLVVPGAGILITLEEAEFAPCYGNTGNFTFLISDALGPDDKGFPPYTVTWYEAYTGKVLANLPSCAQGGFTPTQTSVVGNRVNLFEFTVDIPTGPQFGFRFDGNYSLVVSSCQTLCVQTYQLFVENPQPFVITSNIINSTCARRPGYAVIQISGGLPYAEGQLPPTFIVTPDSTILVPQYYKTFYITPTTGGQYEEIANLGVQQMPGFYSLMALDSENCTVVFNYTIYSPPLLTATFVNATAIPGGVVLFDIIISGGVPPYSTLEAIATNISSGANISYAFINGLNSTMTTFRVIDSVGCISDPISTVTPMLTALSVTIHTTMTCPGQATGTATAIITNSTNPRCVWSTDRGLISGSTSCTQTGLIAGANIAVTVTDAATGATGTAESTIIGYPALVIHQISRTITGSVGDTVCVDNITVIITGGLLPPSTYPYIVTLGPSGTDASVITVSLNVSLFTVINVCREVVYVLIATQAAANCPTSITSVDPQYGFGNDPDSIIPTGLDPTIDYALFPDEHLNKHGNPADERPGKTTTSPAATVAIVLLPLGAVAIVALGILLNRAVNNDDNTD